MNTKVGKDLQDLHIKKNSAIIRDTTLVQANIDKQTLIEIARPDPYLDLRFK